MSKIKDKGKKKGNKLKVDFTGVETRAHIADGQYHAKVAEITVEEGSQANYLKWVFEIISDDKTNGRKLFYNTSLAPQALWNLRNLLETLGVDTPDSATTLDLDEYVGLELMVRVESEVYEGKERPKISDFTPLEETAEVEDDEEEESDEEEEEESDEEEEEEEEAEEEEEEESDDEEEESDDEEEEEDDDDGKVSASEVKEMDEKELADLVKKHKLGVDFKKVTKASKRISAVTDALEAKGLLAKK
jgi:flagellar biosynthesis GTPase FlhF